jgi:uncharacterized protein
MYDTPYYTYRQFSRDRYGAQLQRIPVDLGFGCPNREPDGSGGCTFCSEDGGRARQTLQAGTWAEQVDMAITYARKRYGAEHFMGYCQAYSGTFASAEEQRRCYRQILAHTHFDAFAIGTRPDCLNEDTVAVLKEINTQTDLWIELGVQTVHDKTLDRINRGHDWACSKSAIERLHAAGISCAVHVIVGLPGETEEDYHETARALGRLPIAGIKFHNLHVLRGTQLASDYLAKPFPMLDEHDYAEAVIEGIRLMPADIPIMRIQTDTPAEALIAPRWQMKKGQFIDYVERQMVKRGVRQGDGGR